MKMWLIETRINNSNIKFTFKIRADSKEKAKNNLRNALIRITKIEEIERSEENANTEKMENKL